MTAQVDVQLAADDEFIPTAEDIANWVNRAIDAAGNASNIEVSVRVVGAGEM